MHERLGGRRHDLGRLQVFIRPRLVAQRALAIEEPLAGRVQGLAIILQEIAFILRVGEERDAARAGQEGRALLGPDRGHILTRDVPRVIGGDHHLAQPFRRQVRQRCEVLGIGEEHAVIQRARLAGRGIEALGPRGIHIEVEPVWSPCPHGPAAVHVELFEAPGATLQIGNLGCPKARGVHLESRDPLATAEHGVLSRVGGIRDGSAFAAGVLRCEHQRLGDVVGAAANQHQHVALRLGLTEFAHGVTSAADRGQGLGLGSGIAVATRHGDDEIRWGACG